MQNSAQINISCPQNMQIVCENDGIAIIMTLPITYKMYESIKKTIHPNKYNWLPSVFEHRGKYFFQIVKFFRYGTFKSISDLKEEAGFQWKIMRANCKKVKARLLMEEARNLTLYTPIDED